MPGISICNMDTAGGLILPGTQSKFFYRGQPAATIGSPVAPHGSHLRAVMVQGSVKMNIDGIAVVFAGCRASCDDTATGRPDFMISS
ncbi:hypothetical protein PHABIO_236 [Pseudomonas phage Phabio]|uniref:Uncharacterized protein n=1 Tax=Pseudomonas phage Phabio TaxID=2006668 RepID=A0A1Y0T1Z7_9CAUD|nr:hypothetical protein MZD05_gp236 [Pseudomonas phage Phabio]ARV76867.1 hypothetical protein PHABIO_236 [Pseudomonas phage Phabio]